MIGMAVTLIGSTRHILLTASDVYERAFRHIRRYGFFNLMTRHERNA